jgi:hypothetical protein
MKKIQLITILLTVFTSMAYAQKSVEIYSYGGTMEGKNVVFKFNLPMNWYNYDEGEYTLAGNKAPTYFVGEEQPTEAAKIQKLFIKEGETIKGYFTFESSDYYLASVLGNPEIIGKKYGVDGQLIFDFKLKFIKVE